VKKLNKKGSFTVIAVLLVIIVVLVFIYPLKGGKDIEQVTDKFKKLSCPDVPLNLTCDYGINVFEDDRGCVNAECKTKDSPEFLSELTSLQVFFVDVGQGDGIYIETPNDNHIIIDTGKGDAMMDFLVMRGIDKIDWLIATHPDADHIGGMDEIFDQFVVLNYVETNFSCDTQTCIALDRIVDDEEGIIRHVGDATFEFEGLDLDWKILNPNPELAFDDKNDQSIVIRLDYKDVEFLFTGDCGKDCEDMIVRLDKDASADILKVGHHGSSSATTVSFLIRVNPAFAVLSYGETNQYGHPHKEVIDRLVANDIKIVRTASAGNIEVRTDGTKVEWFCDKKGDCFQ